MYRFALFLVRMELGRIDELSKKIDKLNDKIEKYDGWIREEKAKPLVERNEESIKEWRETIK